MTDSSAPADDAALSAYLDGELSPAETAALDARIAADPALAARLDALADALVALRGVDAAVPPDGFEARLRTRLDTERRRGGAGAPPPAAPPPAPAGATTADLAAARARRARSTRWWTGAGAVAAVLVGVAVVGVGLRSGGSAGLSAEFAAPPGGDARAGRSAPLAPAAGEAESATEAAGGAQDAPSAGAGDARRDTDDAAAAALAPVLVDEAVALADPAAVADRFAALPETAALLGRPRDEAASLARSYGAAVERAEPFDGGVAPAGCLDTVLTAATGPLVPARVERVVYQRRPALAYVLVGASGGSAALDRVEVWIVSPDDCATVLFRQVER